MIVGIDLGTTNSAVALWRDGRAELVPNALGELLTPSAISLTDAGELLVGAAARDRQPTHPLLTATNFKRLMGTKEKLKLGRRDYLAEDLSALVLAALRRDVEAFTGTAPDEAVITVPAYFNDRQRKATRRAGELAGFTVRRLLNEPTAAALAYGLQDRGEKEPFLVFDLGGGTFDVSIVEIFEDIIEVRASAGDNRLGGEDFNDALVALVRPRLDADVLGAIDPVRREQVLRAAAERARRALGEAASVTFAVTNGERESVVEVTAAEFEGAVQPLLARLREPVLRSLRDSDIRADTVSEVVLAGGATRMPVVRRAITRMFGRFPNGTVHPDHAIALGAGVQAGLAMRDSDLDEVRLTDVCPYTLGVDHAVRDTRGTLHGGLFSPIISRNAAVPTSRVESYSTIVDNQKEIEFGIYQGEAREVAGNVKLGTLKIAVPPRRAGEIHVDCRFSYDSSGLLEVDVTVPATGVTTNLVIMDEEDAPDAKEIARRREALARLKVHPREESANMATRARAERCYESFTGVPRERIGEWLLAFDSALDAQEPHAIAEVRRELEAALDALEGERFL